MNPTNVANTPEIVASIKVFLIAITFDDDLNAFIYALNENDPSRALKLCLNTSYSGRIINTNNVSITARIANSNTGSLDILRNSSNAFAKNPRFFIFSLNLAKGYQDY